MTEMITSVASALVARLPRWALVLLVVGLLAVGVAWGVAQLLPGGSADRLVLWLLLFDLVELR